MSKKKADYSRRDFLRAAGAVGLGTMLSPVKSITYAKGESDPNESQQKLVPTRPFGKTGMNVPILALGGTFSKYPEDRKKVFLVTKSQLRETIGWDWHLNDSLEKMNTEYIDLYFIHENTSYRRVWYPKNNFTE